MSSVPSPGIVRPPRPERGAGSDPGCHEAHWRINGFPATITIWTAAAWDLLSERPPDAQYVPCGIWCSLRMDD
jgi:hypothetical protein